MPLLERRRRRGGHSARRCGAQALAASLATAAVVGAQAQPVVADAATPAALQRSFALNTGLAMEATALDTQGRVLGSGAEVITRLTPSLTMTHRGGGLQGTLAYSGSLIVRRGIEDREQTEYLNSLSANYMLEAIKGVGYVDSRATIGQQSISAVGAPVGDSQSSGNRNEVTTFALSPYLRGTLGGAAEYELRGTGSATRGSQDTSGDSNTAQGTFYLRSTQRGTIVGWGLSGSRSRVGFLAASAPTITDRLIAELSLQPDVDWRLSVNGGQERTDVIGALRQKYENYGATVQWTPSKRTTVSLQGEERYFGHGYRLGIEHRLGQSAFRFAASRDINVGSDALSQGHVGVSSGLFGSPGISVQQRQELTWTWTGQRLTTSVSGFSLDSERADIGGVNPAGRNDNTSQTGYAGSIGWRLTPLTSVNASGSRTMTQDTVSLVRSDLKSVSLGLTSQLGTRTTGALSGRYSVFNGGPAESYREIALTGSISLRF